MIVAIIQARMGSSRLPGKVIKEIMGKPLISYLLDKVSQVKLIDKIIIATTTNREDDILSKYIQDSGYEVFRGSENDVLSRYYESYNNLGEKRQTCTGIVRLTGDCPFIQVNIINRVIQKYLENNADHVCLSERFAEGLDIEIFKPEILIKAHNNAMLPSEREHVMLYINNNKNLYKMFQIENKTDDSIYRITVDEQEDFIVAKNIIEHLTTNNIPLDIEFIKQYLDEHKEIFLLNANIIRNEGLIKSVKNDKVT